MSKTRILYADILKFFTMYLVVWGHAIMHFQPDYEDSFIFKIIYSFHMPLFMMLSGYFAASSMEFGFKKCFAKRLRQLLLPCLSWGIFCWLTIRSGLIEGKFCLEIAKLFTGWLGLIDNFWFLKSCFICYSLSWVCWRFGRYKLVAMLLMWFLCTLQGRFFLNMMFPSFLIGLYMRKSTWFEIWLSRYIYVPVIVFQILLLMKLCVMEVEPYPFRLLLGVSGAISSFLLFKSTIGKLSSTSLLEKVAQLGRETLGVYVLQAILLEMLLPRYVDFSSLSFAQLVIFLPILAFFALIICFIIVQTISCSNILAFLMFGRNYRL